MVIWGLSGLPGTAKSKGAKAIGHLEDRIVYDMDMDVVTPHLRKVTGHKDETIESYVKKKGWMKFRFEEHHAVQRFLLLDCEDNAIVDFGGGFYGPQSAVLTPDETKICLGLCEASFNILTNKVITMFMYPSDDLELCAKTMSGKRDSKRPAHGNFDSAYLENLDKVTRRLETYKKFCDITYQFGEEKPKKNTEHISNIVSLFKEFEKKNFVITTI